MLMVQGGVVVGEGSMDDAEVVSVKVREEK